MTRPVAPPSSQSGVRVATPQGDARVVRYAAAAPWASVLLSHGAGGGLDAPDLVAAAAVLPSLGVEVVLVEQPWRVAGRRVASPPPRLDEAFRAVVERVAPAVPYVVGGRSAGARVACRTARHLGASGCLALSFPLHAPGAPERTRVGELLAASVPTLVVQGERDPFGAPDLFPEGVDLTVVPGADHSFAVRKQDLLGREEVLAVVVEAVLEWITREIA